MITQTGMRLFAAATLVVMLITAFMISTNVSNAATPVAGDPHHAATPNAADDPCIVAGMGTPAAAMEPGSGMNMGTPVTGMAMMQEFDLMFIDMMIPHHEDAVAMAKIALVRAEHEEIRTLAENVIASQTAEIEQMKAWRIAWYPDAPVMAMDQMNMAMMEMMTDLPGMEGMSGMMGMSMDMAADMAELCTADPFDRAFMEGMIPHHQTAVMMAQVALVQSVHPEMTQLAENILAAQEAEIAQMQGWLVDWYGATPTA